jgi:hypothetical protein
MEKFLYLSLVKLFSFYGFRIYFCNYEFFCTYGSTAYAVKCAQKDIAQKKMDISVLQAVF